jgi:hypothetical protein
MRRDAVSQNTQRVFYGAGIPAREEVPHILQPARGARPGEAIASFVDGQPLEALMLFSKSDIRILVDERCKDDRHLYGLSPVQVEAVHCDVVKSLDIESRLLVEFPDCGVFRTLSCVDLAIHEFP